MSEDPKRIIPGSDKSNRILRLWPALVLLIAVALFFNEMVFGNLILARGDTYAYFYPYWQAAAEALRQGHVPLWNANLFMGAPFLANSQAGTFYPLNWPLWLLFPAPYAVNASIVIHLLIASAGAYVAGRKCLSLSSGAALLAALLFALGGYATAQIEHVNQFQGLAWLPWMFAVSCAWLSGSRDHSAFARTTLLLGLLLALQMLAGHFQTLFISVVGLSIWLITSLLFGSSTPSVREGGPDKANSRGARLAVSISPFLLGAGLALLLASVQLAPSLELARHSSRAGGLPVNEVLSFSLHPLLLARSLLPTYGQHFFSEYVALLPLTAILLALIGGWQWRSRPGVIALAAVAIAGVLLALGLFNPAYHLLARLPLFNLFRAPARWLALYGLGMALLAGVGWDVLKERLRDEASSGHPGRIRKPLRIGAAMLILLMIWGLLSVPLAQFIPVGKEASVEAPSILIYLGWVAELIVAYALIVYLTQKSSAKSPYGLAVVTATTLLVLFMATRAMPYNNLTTPEAFFGLRPPVARLRVLSACSDGSGDCVTPPGRLLSLSDIFFDIGDQPEIDSAYADQLSADAQYDNTIAVKQQEVLGPNLPMLYELPSVDGFDGGILPLRNFTILSRLMLPAGEETTDGRLRENLDVVPDSRWLDLFNTRYLITDKVADAWQEGVFFDLQHPVEIIDGGEVGRVGHLPPFEADQLWIVADGPAGKVEIETAAGETWLLEPGTPEGELHRIRFPRPAISKGIRLLPCSDSGDPESVCKEPWRVKGLTLFDSRDETFQPLVLGQYRLIYSGDVKIYENLDALPRAFMVFDWEYFQEASAAVEAMRLDGFDPRNEAVLVGAGPLPSGSSGNASVRLQDYDAEGFSLTAESDRAAFLIVTDAHYPGWVATVDGDPAEILLANGNFRGVYVPAGEHEVVFTYRPASYRLGIVLSLTGLALLLVLATSLFLSTRGFKRP